MNTQTFLIVLLGCSTLVACKEMKFKDCGSVLGMPSHVYIKPCSTDPCIAHKGGNMTIAISFTPNEVVNSVKASVKGIIAGIPVPFPIPGDDGCVESGLTCPLKAGVEMKYFKTMEILDKYPSLKLIVKFELKDEHKRDIICIEGPLEIQ